MRYAVAVLALLVPTVAIAKAPPPPPNSLVIIACRGHAAPEPTDIDASNATFTKHSNFVFDTPDDQFACKREVIADIVDAVGEQHPELRELRPNMARQEQCGIVGVTLVPDWERAHPGWGVVGIGCPVPMMDDQGTPNDPTDDVIVGWVLPSCPEHIPGDPNTPMKCSFDDTQI